MKILVKFPTRSRPLQFLKVLSLLKKAEGVQYLVTTDNDDPTMAHFEQEGVLVDKGISNSKIHACNRGLEKLKDWDIVVLISDDMIPQLENWDKVIKRDMIKNFPDTDGCLWYNDGYQDRICTLFGWLSCHSFLYTLPRFLIFISQLLHSHNSFSCIIH